MKIIPIKSPELDDVSGGFIFVVPLTAARPAVLAGIASGVLAAGVTAAAVLEYLRS